MLAGSVSDSPTCVREQAIKRVAISRPQLEATTDAGRSTLEENSRAGCPACVRSWAIQDQRAGSARSDLAEWDHLWVAQFAGVDAAVHLAGDPSPLASWASAQRLNIDLTANVYEAAAMQGVPRVVFASSNWVMAGHRPTQGALTTDMEPYPINPYGVSKLVGERMGRSVHARRGLSVICFRVGYLQRGDNRPGTHMGWGGWGQAMWLSNRDLCQAMERSVMAGGIGSAGSAVRTQNSHRPEHHSGHARQRRRTWLGASSTPSSGWGGLRCLDAVKACDAYHV